ncbi:MAG: peptide ABC transporter permease [Desulfobacterales bacterium]|nr:peptide ABC transporter permease [Desulfobacterales bacterium]
MTRVCHFISHRALSKVLAAVWCALILQGASHSVAAAEIAESGFMNSIAILSAMGDRSTGTPGCGKAADYIRNTFSGLGYDQTGTQLFSTPVVRHYGSTLSVPGSGEKIQIAAFRYNVITPETIPPPGMEGPLFYVGSGSLAEFNGKAVSGAVILMEMDSGKNWLHAASLGARALIYIDRGNVFREQFEEKVELSPVEFPCFWSSLEQIQQVFGDVQTAPDGRVSPLIRLTSNMRWEDVEAENVYCLIPGTDPKLDSEMMIVEAFYDSTAMVSGRSPGADEACSIATLLDLARTLKRNPPGRAVLLVATAGHAQTLAGMREMIWSISTPTRNMRELQKQLSAMVEKSRAVMISLQRVSIENLSEARSDALFAGAVSERIKTEVDEISRELMRLRLQNSDASNQQTIQQLARRRLLLRRMGWRSAFSDLSNEEQNEMRRLIPLVAADHQEIITDATGQLNHLKSARQFRARVVEREPVAVISLHLSSHGAGAGAFNRGWLYSLKSDINRVEAYSAINDMLLQAAAKVQQTTMPGNLFQDTLRPNRLRPWQSFFPDKPFMGGEVSALAGYVGLTLATVNDARQRWGTPDDRMDQVDDRNGIRQSALICALLKQLAESPVRVGDKLLRQGFASVTGRANFIRHGELFADQPAPGTILMCYQGRGRYYARVDAMGRFYLHGVADKKHVLDKVIIEGYRFDPVTGAVVWAIDKKQTGKDAYRIKMSRRFMETNLVMFACRQTTLFNLLEPRSFRYLTKIQLIDGRRDAPPARYWYSRIDTRASVVSSIYLESGSRLKMTLSDTMLTKKMILTHASERQPEGTGYRVDEWPCIHRTEFMVAQDMWVLLGPRIENLERHGVADEQIRQIQQEGQAALASARGYLAAMEYDRFFDSARRSWALASRVYDHVDATQKDVLLGVLFYIALFVPFAFSMERLMFSYADIHKRIIAFFAILLVLIAVIYHVHPAFELAYSPMVVILAFFIMGLSLVVTLIIFFRFEQEMMLLQRRAKHMRAEEISRWKAFAAAFFLGVSNLSRRRLRTVLTCMTLIILTFTIMSFTSVKSVRRHSRILFQNQSPYHGLLLKRVGWNDLPVESLDILADSFEGRAVALPRVWMENEDRTQPVRVPVRFQDRVFEGRGLVGLSYREMLLAGRDRMLTGGRWFNEHDRNAILLPERMARYLGIDPAGPGGVRVYLWGKAFEVVGTFSDNAYDQWLDLDGEPLTPVTFPGELSMEMTEVEQEAMESGEDVSAFQSRYQHLPADQTIIIPCQTLLTMGGNFKSLAVYPDKGASISQMARQLIDRFGLTLFAGQPDGTFVYNVSDTLSYSGMPNIVIPLLISILIVLNTMVGSVYERKREIAVYTSVGLAPSHVSFLFVAEAMAFAVISVVFGYILAQTTAVMFSGTSLWKGITVNYSSLTGVAAMMLVFLVVLVSVLYPSRVASRIAIPDVNRGWALPEPVGNVLEVTLPFLMKYGENRSIGAYVFVYFNEHQNVSHGMFSTGDLAYDFACPVSSPVFSKDAREQFSVSEAIACDQACFLFHANVWLAPFDFGIMQRVELSFCPSAEDSGFLEIKVKMIRLSGEVNAWKRINRTFLHQLRKQLLVWRSLDREVQQHYESLLDRAEEQKIRD